MAPSCKRRDSSGIGSGGQPRVFTLSRQNSISSPTDRYRVAATGMPYGSALRRTSTQCSSSQPLQSQQQTGGTDGYWHHFPVSNAHHEKMVAFDIVPSGGEIVNDERPMTVNTEIDFFVCGYCLRKFFALYYVLFINVYSI